MGCHRKVDCAGSDTTKAEKQSLTCAGGGPPRLIAVIGRPGGVHLHLLARRHSARSGAHGGVLSRSPTLLRCGRPARRYNRDRCRLRALRELRGARAEHARSTRAASQSLCPRDTLRLRMPCPRASKVSGGPHWARGKPLGENVPRREACLG